MAIDDYTDYPTKSANPYYLHPNENPATILVSPPLDHKNYHSWARSMQMALISKNKDKFIDGTLPRPSVTDPMYAAWMRCNTTVTSWVHRSLTDGIARSILWIDSAAGVWKNLKTRFSQGDIFRISDIQEELYRFRQGNLEISNYFTQLKVLWDELESYRPIAHCKCAIACTCGAVDSMKIYREQDYVIRFLKGLNERYSHTKSQIMLMKPLPDIDTVLSMLIQQEREFTQSVLEPIVHDSPETENSSALMANSQVGKGKFIAGKGRGQGFNSKGNNRVCTHCNRINHTIESCWVKHGYPPSFKNKWKGSSQSNNVTGGNENSIQGDSAPSSSNKPPFSLTQEQYQGILGIVQQSKAAPASAATNNASINTITTNPLALNSQSSNGQGKSPNL